ncbi:diadenosine tetraphosphatase [Buchnera aphidicola (Nipponaphis monzeni)]|uniref:bis(5'-nucleosyl)-tetraphosphatase (symmetrical) n=1 Tax=Buchnera aphidicola (Nipponaphis monzeni) TaxID=2495405 RepID=A0A455T9V5_9GAMM|nr:symmetrical bis(5'-nucleosyl)-tetraphosphatase [Buchnera aphidicola]BBI01128.1 diadenosine tetraphosphatase [Buchnera aphidicola (Nipponaphis monzeni)]
MSTYFIGDIHGCYKQLRLLLEKVKFNSVKDQLWITGDLVARGPESLQVLRYISSLKNSAKTVLGNHDLYLIKSYFTKNYTEGYISELFKAKDIEHLIYWLIKQPLLRINLEKKIILVHAGIPPQWNVETAQSCIKELELEFNNTTNIINVLNLVETNDQRIIWKKNLNKNDRLKFSINALTRMRYCFLNGDLNMLYKDYPISVKFNVKPWFLIANNIPKDFSIIFGHWASLQGKNTPQKFFALDTGCSWGEHLTIIRWEDKKTFTQPFLC